MVDVQNVADTTSDPSVRVARELEQSQYENVLNKLEEGNNQIGDEF